MNECVLGTGLAAFPQGGHVSWNGAASTPGNNPSGGSNFYQAPFALALVDAPTAFLGMHPSGSDYFSTRLRLDLIPDAADRSTDVRGVDLRFPDSDVPLAHAVCRTRVSRARYRGSSRARWSRSFSVEALPGPGRTSSPVLRTGLLADHSPIRDFGDRTCTHGFAEVAARRVLRFSRDSARDHRDRRAALSPVWKVFPYFSASRSARREVLSGGGRSWRARGLQALRWAFRFQNAYRRLEPRPPASWIRLPHRGKPIHVAGDLPGMQAEIIIARATAPERGRSWLSCPFHWTCCWSVLVHTRLTPLRAVGRTSHATPLSGS